MAWSVIVRAFLCQLLRLCSSGLQPLAVQPYCSSPCPLEKPILFQLMDRTT